MIHIELTFTPLLFRKIGFRCQQTDDGEQKTVDSEGASSSSFHHLSSETLYETTPKWHGLLMIRLVALAVGSRTEQRTAE